MKPTPSVKPLTPAEIENLAMPPEFAVTPHGTFAELPPSGNVRSAFIDARTNSGIIVITFDGRWFQYNENGVGKVWRELPQPPEL